MKGGPFEGITPWFKLIVHSMLPTWWENIDNLNAFKNHETVIAVVLSMTKCMLSPAAQKMNGYLRLRYYTWR